MHWRALSDRWLPDIVLSGRLPLKTRPTKARPEHWIGRYSRHSCSSCWLRATNPSVACYFGIHWRSPVM